MTREELNYEINRKFCALTWTLNNKNRKDRNERFMTAIKELQKRYDKLVEENRERE